MAEISPLTFFRFAADHVGLITDIFYHSSGLSDSRLRYLVIRHRKPTDPSPHYVMEQLIRLGILETVPDATASYEMTRPVSTLLSYLLRRHRLTSVRVIQAYLTDIEHLSTELSSFLEKGDSQGAVRILDETAEVMERIRQDSRSNRDGIIAKAILIKANRERQPVRERFETINRLWSRYIVPLRDLIDVRKAMDDALDKLEVLFRDGSRVFGTDGAMIRELSSASARLLRLRRDVKADYHESLTELGPLYESLRRDTALARGAGRALEITGRKGLRHLRITEFMSFPTWRTEGLVSTKALEAYLYGIKGYRPLKAPALAEAAVLEPEKIIEPVDLERRLWASLPVEDLLSWLIENHAGCSATEILKAYGRVLDFRGLSFFTGAEDRTYGLGAFTVEAHPRSVASENGERVQG